MTNYDDDSDTEIQEHNILVVNSPQNRRQFSHDLMNLEKIIGREISTFSWRIQFSITQTLYLLFFRCRLVDNEHY